jgi:CheY-like chemotaxis protein/anti-sigma regulatory factor (Ser/Thr protein kinase)
VAPLRAPQTTDGRAIEIETHFAGVPAVAGDAGALREALSNIVVNAVDAMPSGGRLIVATDTAGDEVTVSVTDTGVGMSDGVRFRAQQPFFTTKGVKSTGLGLSVAYGIVRTHGGDVSIRSAEGAGTTVTVTLPQATAAHAADSEAQDALRILLVDDESDVREALADMLASSGHTVLTVSDGDEALAVVEREPGLDLVLTDLVMPGTDGWQVAAATKARRPHVAVGLVTGWGQPLDRSDAPRRGVDFVLDKPVSLDVLRDVLARVRRR